MLCIDRLGAAFCRLTEQSLQNTARYDGKGTLHLMMLSITFAELVESAFGQIREFNKSTAVRVRLIQTLAIIARHTRQEEDHAALLRQAAIIERSSEGSDESTDRRCAPRLKPWFASSKT